MFNDERQKFEIQLVVIDALIKYTDGILEAIRSKNLETPAIKESFNSIFSFGVSIVKAIKMMDMFINAQIQSQLDTLQHTLETASKHWGIDDNLFIINWFLFVEQWTEILNNINNSSFSSQNINLSLN